MRMVIENPTMGKEIKIICLVDNRGLIDVISSK
jgi:hypothetical protein